MNFINKRYLHFSILFSFLLVGAGNLQAANTPIVRDGNIDGGARIMSIHCPSGTRTTVRLYVSEFKQYRPGQTCIYLTDGSDLCRMNWDLDEAAVEACNQ